MRARTTASTRAGNAQRPGSLKREVLRTTAPRLARGDVKFNCDDIDFPYLGCPRTYTLPEESRCRGTALIIVAMERLRSAQPPSSCTWATAEMQSLEEVCVRTARERRLPFWWDPGEVIKTDVLSGDLGQEYGECVPLSESGPIRYSRCSLASETLRSVRVEALRNRFSASQPARSSGTKPLRGGSSKRRGERGRLRRLLAPWNRG
jgi:hypothetical protein